MQRGRHPARASHSCPSSLEQTHAKSDPTLGLEWGPAVAWRPLGHRAVSGPLPRGSVRVGRPPFADSGNGSQEGLNTHQEQQPAASCPLGTAPAPAQLLAWFGDGCSQIQPGDRSPNLSSCNLSAGPSWSRAMQMIRGFWQGRRSRREGC